MDITFNEKKKRDELLQKSYEYLCDNFHKFKDDKKLKIALEIIKRRIPQDLNLSGQISVEKIEVEIVK